MTDKLIFTQRCHGSWSDLCDALGIKPYERKRFRQGHEPAAIWEWLEARGRLAELHSALVRVDRQDLADEIGSVLMAERTKDPGGEQPAGRGKDRRWRLVLAVTLPAILVIVGGLIVFSVWSSRSHGEPTVIPSASSIGARSPAATVDIAAMAGPWAGTLHCDPRWCNPADYPIAITLHPGKLTEVVGGSQYAEKGCKGTLTFTGVSDSVLTFTENIVEPRRGCTERPMYFTARLVEPDKLEIEYWWAAQINPSSESYAKATLTRAE